MKRVLQKSYLYVTVRNAIVDAILEGEIAQNDRLPSEDALAEMFSVSRATIRNALQSMENDGLITKHHGSETVVNHVCLGLNMRIDEAKGFSDLIAASGHTPGLIYRTFEKKVIDSRVSKKLHVEKNSEGYVLTKLLSGDGNPVVYIREFYPESLLNKIPEQDNIPSDIYKLSDLYFKEAISYTVREISAVRESADLLKAMQLKSGTGFIRMEEIHYSSGNRPIAYNETFIRDSIMKLQVVCRRM